MRNWIYNIFLIIGTVYFSTIKVHAQQYTQTHCIAGVIAIDNKLPLHLFGEISNVSNSICVSFIYIPGSFIFNKEEFLSLQALDSTEEIRLRITHIKQLRPRKYDTCSYIKYMTLEKFLYENFILNITNNRNDYWVKCVSPIGEIEIPCSYKYGRCPIKNRKVNRIFFPKWHRVGQKYKRTCI